MKYHAVLTTLPYLAKKSFYEQEKTFESEKSLEDIMKQHIRDGHRVALLEWTENSIKYEDRDLGCICNITKI